MLVVGLASPASAGTLTSASFTAPTPYTYTQAQGARYDWGFTTATTSTLSKATMSVPSGTGGGNRYLATNGIASNYASTPDSANNSVLGDIDIRVRATAQWQGSFGQTLVAKRGVGGDAFSLIVSSANNIEFSWSTTGSGMAAFPNVSNPGWANGSMRWLRVTHSTVTGLTTFFTSADGISWSTLATVGGSSGAIADTTSLLTVGGFPGGGSLSHRGAISYAELRNGIDGTVVNKFDPNEANPAAPSSWASGTGETWTVNRSGTNLPADIATDLSVGPITGLPQSGTANYRFIDGVATYNFTPTSVSLGTAVTLNLGGFTNTATPGNYASTITTYNNVGPPPVAVDSVTTATLSFTATSSNSTVTVTVDPSLTFTVGAHAGACNGVSQTPGASVSGVSVGLGRVNSANGVGAQSLETTTNAGGGALVYVRSTGGFSSSNGHTIAAVSGTNVNPGAFPSLGSEGFGYTTNDATLFDGVNPQDRFTNGGAKWAALTGANAPVTHTGVGYEYNCVAYQVGASATSPAGSYSTTIIYTAVPTF